MNYKMEKDNTWYIAITGFGGHYYSLVAAGSKSYGGFAELFNKAGGSKIVAEQFDVSDEVVNRITGFDKSNKPTKEKPLRDLVDRLNNGEVSNVQKALSKLCAVES